MEQDLKVALKSQDRLKISVIRMLLSEIHNKEIQAKGQLSEEQVMSVLAGAVKKHQDSIEQFASGGRADLSEQEKAELGVIQAYLPEPLPEPEIRQLVAAAIAEVKPQGPKDFGKVMQAVMARAKGRAGGAMISQMVKEQLQ